MLINLLFGCLRDVGHQAKALYRLHKVTAGAVLLRLEDQAVPVLHFGVQVILNYAIDEEIELAGIDAKFVGQDFGIGDTFFGAAVFAFGSVDLLRGVTDVSDYWHGGNSFPFVGYGPLVWIAKCDAALARITGLYQQAGDFLNVQGYCCGLRRSLAGEGRFVRFV